VCAVGCVRVNAQKSRLAKPGMLPQRLAPALPIQHIQGCLAAGLPQLGREGRLPAVPRTALAGRHTWKATVHAIPSAL
jgi:hypothetical protein